MTQTQDSKMQNTLLKFVLQTRSNKRLLIVVSASIILQFLIFKRLYPFADFFSDSYSYIYAASAHLDVSIWPIGYSKFLSIVHDISHSDKILVGFQYFFLELSCLYFYFTILYFYDPPKASKAILIIFLFLNPLCLYISNYVNSDPIFASLSVIWATELFWIVKRPKYYQLLTHTIVLFFCFTVRNNAYYYPFISVLAFLLSNKTLTYKIVGIVSPLALIGWFVLFTQSAAEKLTGQKMYSLFTGWQLANNALYMYNHITVDTTILPSNQSRQLNSLSKAFYHNIRPDFDAILWQWDANFFIQHPKSPLKVYFADHFQAKDELELVANWGKASIVYEEYGKWLILHYPKSYVKYFMSINAGHFFLPPLEKLRVYNLGSNTVGRGAQDWFNYKTSTVRSISNSIQEPILSVFPYIFLFLNAMSLGSIVWYLIKKFSLPKRSLQRNPTLTIIGALLAANFCFCMVATIVVLRYQFFPMIMTLVFDILIMDYLGQRISSGQIVKPHKESLAQASLI